MTPVMEALYKDIIGHWPMPNMNDQDAADHIRQHVQDQLMQAGKKSEEDAEVIDFYTIDLNMPYMGDFLLWDDDTQASYLSEAYNRAFLYGKQRD